MLQAMEAGLGLALPCLLPEPHACVDLPALLATLPAPHIEPLPHVDLTIGSFDTEQSGASGAEGQQSFAERPGGLTVGVRLLR